MKTKKVKIGDLVIDPELIRIRKINDSIVSRYRQHYREGVIMPALLVEESTLRVVSGNHRLTAMLKEFKPDKKIEVNVKSYPSQKELLEDFARENANHGMPLSGFTKRSLSIALIKHGSTAEEVSRIFGVSVRKIEELCDGVVRVDIGKGKEEDLPAKPNFEGIGKVLTKQQYEEHFEKDRGIPFVSQVNQIIRWLKNDYVIPNDKNIKALEELRECIDNYLDGSGSKVAV